MRANLIITITMIVSFGCFHVKAQNINLEMKTGYGSYAMDDLSHTMHYYQNYYHDLKITDDYPGFVNFGGRMMVGFDKWNVGIDYTYYSTGARAQYKDYSGETGFDQIVIANALGANAKYAFFEANKFKMKVTLLTSLYMSKARFNEYYRTASANDENKLTSISKSIAFTPGLEPVFQLSDKIYVGLNVGLCFDLGGVLSVDGDKDKQLYNENNDLIHTQWSGLRSEIFIGIKLADE
jgi:hypothetical protein